ncbi:MAG: LAGLIDADG family homing endonuclease [Candidatus Nanohaloarchaea archaeon]
MVNRVSVSKEELQKVRKNLKTKRNLSIREISECIGTEFKNHLYKDFNMSLEVFEKLQNLFGSSIEHELVDHRNGVSYDKRVLSLTKDKDLAEFFGMMLGDGHMEDFYEQREDRHITNYRVDMCFHEDETEIIDRAEELFLEAVGKEPNYYSEPNSKAAKLMVYSKDLVERLEELGLESGNKTDNQVCVPGWIKENPEFRVRCLKGLVDTDGTVYERVPGDTVIQFKNASQPLLDDFKEMCETEGISTSKGGYRSVQVAANDEVDKFIRLIQPIKARG